MTVKVLEHDGIYTAYRLVVKRDDRGTLREAVKQIDIPIPPPNGNWTGWAAALSEDQLEVGLQVFYDKWNFGRGEQGDHTILCILTEERKARRNRGVTSSSELLTPFMPISPSSTVTTPSNSKATVKVVNDE